MSDETNELEPEVLSYRAFRNRQLLHAWQQRRRAHQARQYREQEHIMNKDQMSGGWHQIKGKVKQQWGKLTDDDLQQLEGNSEQLAGKIQQRYGLAKEDAERQAREFRTRHNWT